MENGKRYDQEYKNMIVDCLGIEMICFIDILKVFKYSISNLKKKSLKFILSFQTLKKMLRYYVHTIKLVS